MTALLKHQIISTTYLIEQDIRANAAWLGLISGLKADKLLRSYKTPFLYVLREGEQEGDYYVTYIKSDSTVFHQPFTITRVEGGWIYENGGTGLYPEEARLEDILHLIMHCEKGQCQPLIV